MRKNVLSMFAATLSCSLMLTSCFEVFDNPSVNINEESDFSSMMDLGTYVGDDFYQYVLGTWIANNPVPTKDGAKSVGMLDEQDVITDEALKEIVSGQKNEIATALYKAYSQETLKDDSTALMKKLAEVDAMKTKDDLTKLLAQLAKQGYACPFYILPNTSQRKVYPELGTIDDFKLKEESIIKLGISSAEAKAIMDMGAKWEGIVKDISGKQSGKHVLGHYNPFEGKQLFTTFKARGEGKSLIDAMAAALDINLSTIAADASCDKFFDAWTAYSLDDQKRLAKCGILSRDMNYLPYDPLRPSNQEDQQKLIDKIAGLCKKEYSGLQTSMSHTYVETIDKAAKKEVIDMFEELRGVFRGRIQNNSWMGDATKAKAIEKLDAIIFMCGWPDNFHTEWEATVPTGKSFYEMVCNLFSQYSDIMKKLIGLTSEDAFHYCEWMQVPAYTANAFYNDKNNSINILACNLVPPIYDKNQQAFYNYAILGATTIGHEMTHGFDANGSQYDAIGKQAEWWDPQDKAVFKEKQKQMINHFDKLEYMPGVYCDGEKTLSENIADLGGLEIAYEAYMNKVSTTTRSKRQYLAREFFRAFADAWRQNETPEKMKKYETDVHAAPKLRVNGNVCLTDAWYRVFDITEGHMYLAPDERIQIW